MKPKTEWDGLNRNTITHIKDTATSDWKPDGWEVGVIYKAEPPCCIGLRTNEKARGIGSF